MNTRPPSTPNEIRDALEHANERAIQTIDTLTEAFGPTHPRTDHARNLGLRLFNALAEMQEYATLAARPVNLDAPAVVPPVRLGGAA